MTRKEIIKELNKYVGIDKNKFQTMSDKELLRFLIILENSFEDYFNE